MWCLLTILACVSPGSRRQATADPVDSSTIDSGPATPDTASGHGSSGDTASACPLGMVQIEGFCVDRYEAVLGTWSPYDVPSSGVIATVAEGVVPQGYISQQLAAGACVAAGKRLCSLSEWLRACQGPSGTTYPYGNSYDPAACNDTRASHPVVDLFGAATDWSAAQMNDPRINQQADTVDLTGANPGCVSAEGVFDLHGNLHEWIDDPSGTFKGGFYADAVLNGPGCTYTTSAHTVTYHDYSTGFRCCTEAR